MDNMDRIRLENLAADFRECAEMIKNLNTDNINDVEELYGRLMDLRTDVKYKGLNLLDKML